MIPHPVTQIMLWVGLAVLVQTLQSALLPVLASILCLVALNVQPSRLLQLLRRTRWIFFSLLLIYAFATPGSELWSANGLPAATKEGLLDGMMQISRLLCVLAGLSILLSVLTQAQLVGGLFVLAYPLRYLGISRERIALRLGLTLHYAEIAMQETAQNWRSGIERALQVSTENTAGFELQLQKPGWIDGVLLFLLAASMFGMWR